MKTRLRWLSLALSPARIRQLAEGMRAEAYTPERAHGFVVTHARTRAISGRHVEKRVVEASVVDPLGAKFTQTITEFREARFVLSTDAPGMELIDSPRAPKLFLTRLGHLLQFKVPIEPVEVDPLAWLASMEDADLDVAVREVEYTHIAVAKAVVGVVRVSSDTADVRAAASKLLANRMHRVRRVTATLRGAVTSGRSIECRLDRAGAAVLPEEDSADLVALVRSALVAARAKD